jgi:hypothetical protein
VDLHVISPEPEALPTPPWFLDNISEDITRNPPNSPAHSSTETLHPTTVGTPQSFNIWFMSSEPSPSSSLTPLFHQQGATTLSLRSLLMIHYIPVVSNVTKTYWKRCNAQNPPGTCCIIVHSSFPKKPSCLLVTILFFRSKPKTVSPQERSIGSKTPFLHLTLLKKVTWLTFPPTIKIDISIKPGIVEEIIIGAVCTPTEITAYKALFQEFRDIFAWSYTEMPGLDPSIVEHRIDTWPDITPVHQK